MQGRAPDIAPSPQATAAATQPAAPATSAPRAATATPMAPSAAPQQPLSGGADTPLLNGRFRVTDTVTDGQGAGLVVNFDVDLRQNGASITGGSGEITMTGAIEG